jgi:hypothetical protein
MLIGCGPESQAEQPNSAHFLVHTFRKSSSKLTDFIRLFSQGFADAKIWLEQRPAESWRQGEVPGPEGSYF